MKPADIVDLEVMGILERIKKDLYESSVYNVEENIRRNIEKNTRDDVLKVNIIWSIIYGNVMINVTNNIWDIVNTKIENNAFTSKQLSDAFSMTSGI